MHAVVNRLTFADPVDPGLFSGIAELTPAFEAVDGFDSAHVIHTGEREVVLLILARDEATLDRLATEVGSPWMVEHVVPLLAAPPQRAVGAVIGSTTYDAG